MIPLGIIDNNRTVFDFPEPLGEATHMRNGSSKCSFLGNRFSFDFGINS
ncbi:hypothetical protein F441_12602 [Phytophthora nicotianae CJ01A1]|uniref:Uncharacterized protein n=1 Tax=Phytophthora nicotianae CJ01A1 TaxID=1317063 RepID=W2WQV2_PHYNI|nr:hypothetical protein F441_12602 [Phytophthora nicotianae CJ01A1]